MEDSWRFRQSQGNICPTCSNSHFPFCPQPPSRPYFDPISNNRGIPYSLPPFDNRPNSTRPITGPPVDVYNDQVNRIRSRFDYGGSEFMNGEFSETDRLVKRMRMGELGSQIPPSTGGGGGGYSSSGTGLSAEDERRLSLIREHGAPSSVQPTQIGVDSKIGMGSGYVSQGGNRLNGYSYESSFGDWRPRPPGNSFYDPVSGSADRVTRSNGYDEKKEFGRGEHAVGYDRRKLQMNMDDLRPDKEGSGKGSFFTLYNEPCLPPHYGENDIRSSLQSYGLANAQTGAPNYGNTFRPHQNGSSPFLREEESQQPHIAHQVPYDSQQLQGKSFYQNEFPHTHMINSPLSSGSGVPIYENKQNFHIHGPQIGVRRPFEVRHQSGDDFQTSVGPHNSVMVEQFGAPKISEQGTYLPISTGNSMASIRQVQGPTYGASGIYPPLPLLPPPSLPMEPPGLPPYLQARASPPTIPIASSDVASLLHPSALEGQLFPPKNPSPDRPKIIDASSLFKRPYRDTRPDHIVIILRGLPGSGKSYLAKMLRDLEVENGANAPRIHSMDDYFMTEVEKVEESEVSKSSGSAKSKKRVTKKVMEYCYEPEMEEAYRSSMLKAFKKTVEDGTFTFIIVDDRNLRVADFAQFWASAKRSGYEVYLLEAMYKDPVGCAARNIHGFSSDDIHKMAELWEEAPSLYLRLDIQSFHGDDLKEHGIQEVDMDMDDVACDESQSGLQNKNSLKTMEPPQANHSSDDSVKEEERWDAEGDEPGVKELGRSKWSHDADEEDIERSEHAKRAPNALSGLIQAYTKGDKSVHWGDQVGKGGFSIGSSMRAKVSSLVIGPGAGYNLKANPLPEEENEGSTDTSWQSKKRTVFEEHLRAERASERESFKAVVDRRRQRIRGLEIDDQLQ